MKTTSDFAYDIIRSPYMEQVTILLDEISDREVLQKAGNESPAISVTVATRKFHCSFGSIVLRKLRIRAGG